MVDLSKLETADDLALMSLWWEVCEDIGMNSTKKQAARVNWIGIGSRKDVLRGGLIAYRDAKDDAGREAALLGIVDTYDADCRREQSAQ